MIIIITIEVKLQRLLSKDNSSLFLLFIQFHFQHTQRNLIIMGIHG